MNFTKLFVIIAFLAGISACEKENQKVKPTVDFSCSDTEIDIGTSVKFTDLSKGAEKWLWDFGDGNHSTEENPTNIYTSPGIYSVSLEVENEYGTAFLKKDNFIKVSLVNFDEIPMGELVDSRDGQVYRTIKIGNQWWMAENLNYNGGSFYYDENNAYETKKYGKYYLAGTSFSEICPEGWKVPSKNDWEVLFETLAYNGFDYDESMPGNQISKSIASIEDWDTLSYSGLKLGDIGFFLSNNNTTGFNALPSGYCNALFMQQGAAAYFWTSDFEYPEDYLDVTKYYYVNLSISSPTPYIYKFVYRTGMCVRCVKK